MWSYTEIKSEIEIEICQVREEMQQYCSSRRRLKYRDSEYNRCTVTVNKKINNHKSISMSIYKILNNLNVYLRSECIWGTFWVFTKKILIFTYSRYSFIFIGIVIYYYIDLVYELWLLLRYCFVCVAVSVFVCLWAAVVS